MTHLEQRLAERGIHLSAEDLLCMAALCDKDTAIILAKQAYNQRRDGQQYSRLQSNGDLVVLIVRSRLPVTIMFRRSEQGIKPGDLNVERVRDLTLGQRK